MKVGIVSSGSISPCLKKGIALAYIKPGYREIGTELDIVGRKKIRARVVKPPFVKRGKC
jgi:aminomethyltransferase